MVTFWSCCEFARQERRHFRFRLVFVGSVEKMFNGRAVVRFSGIFQSVGSPGGSLLNTNTFTQRKGEATKNY